MNEALDNAVARNWPVPPKLDGRARRGALWFMVVLGLSVAGVLFYFNPSQHAFYPTCMFHRMTGLHCPGCGGLRAVHQLLHGHLGVAMHYNALFVISLPLLAWWGIRSAMEQLCQRKTKPVFSPVWLWGLLIVGIGFSVLRNLPAFNWLAP